jgi:hypothetical protein
MREEFTCAICLDYMLQAHTLDCGHSMCGPCIVQALENQRACPCCRAPTNKAPVRSHALDNAIEKLIKQKGCRELTKERNARREQWKMNKIARERTARRLKNVVAKAKKDGKVFLNIEDSWVEAERQLFAKGVSLYKGPARAVYCKTTRLTTDFVESASLPKLRTAAINVGVSTEPKARCLRAPSLRSLLYMFITYGGREAS